MSDQNKQQEINAILWRARDTFRGTVAPAEYKNYILVTLFLKYVSDVWRDHYDACRARFEEFILPEETHSLDSLLTWLWTTISGQLATAVRFVMRSGSVWFCSLSSLFHDGRPVVLRVRPVQ